MQHCAGLSACCCHIDGLPLPTPKHAVDESIGWFEDVEVNVLVGKLLSVVFIG